MTVASAGRVVLGLMVPPAFTTEDDMTDDNVIDLHTLTTLDIPPSRVWQACLDKDIPPAIAIGYDENGELYFASSVAHAGDVLLLLELAKKQLMESE